MVETGKFIVLEAVDDLGLDGLSEELCRWLRGTGLPVEETAEPTHGPAGTQVRLARQGRLQFDATSLALLYLADRLDHVQHAGGLAHSLAEGRHVICRHYGLAAAARLWGQVEWDWLCSIDSLCRTPDLTLWVDLCPDGRKQRPKLWEAYQAAVSCLQTSGQKIVVVAGTRTPAQAALACKQEIARLLGLDPPSRE
jgi:thymidylate kinase